jgi:ribosomal protein S19
MTHSLKKKKPFKFHRADTLLKIIGDFNEGVEKYILTWFHASTIAPTLISHVIINCNSQKHLFIYITSHMVDNTLGSNEFLI